MPRYKITQHLTGWKVIGNYIDAKDEDEAEYKITDTDIEKEGDTPTEEVKKWKEKNEKV